MAEIIDFPNGRPKKRNQRLGGDELRGKSQDQVEAETTKDYSVLVAEAEKTIAEAEIAKAKVARLGETRALLDRANEITRWQPTK